MHPLRLLEGLFEPGVCTAECSLGDSHPELYPEEAAQVLRAAPKRLAEFRAGRACARRALDALGVPSQAIPMRPDRSPSWPRGSVGSLSHTGTARRGYCAAAVGRATEFRSIGLDAELDEPLAPELWKIILTPEERERLCSEPVGDRGRLAKLAFSIKECAYKCQHPLTGRFLDFSALRVRVEEGGRFSATLETCVGEFQRGHVFRGRYAFGPGLLLTAMSISC